MGSTPEPEARLALTFLSALLSASEAGLEFNLRWRVHCILLSLYSRFLGRYFSLDPSTQIKAIAIDRIQASSVTVIRSCHKKDNYNIITTNTLILHSWVLAYFPINGLLVNPIRLTLIKPQSLTQIFLMAHKAMID